MSVLAITGCSGYLGQCLLAKLGSSSGFDKIIGVDIRSPRQAVPDLFLKTDIRSPELAALFLAEGVTHVAHLAYVVNPTLEPSVEHDIDVRGTENVLSACSRAGVRVLVVASSIAAYGWHADNPIPLGEDAPLRGNPEFPYACNKVEVERLVEAYRRRHPACCTTVLRICNVLGPRVNNAISFAIESPVFLAARGYDPYLAFTHEDDMTAVLTRSLRKPVPGIFNVAGEGMIRLSEMLSLARRTVVHLPPKVLKVVLETLFRLHLLPFGGGQVGFITYSCVPDISRLQSVFGYVPTHSSVETIAGFIALRIAP